MIWIHAISKFFIINKKSLRININLLYELRLQRSCRLEFHSCWILCTTRLRWYHVRCCPSSSLNLQVGWSILRSYISNSMIHHNHMIEGSFKLHLLDLCLRSCFFFRIPWMSFAHYKAKISKQITLKLSPSWWSNLSDKNIASSSRTESLLNLVFVILLF